MGVHLCSLAVNHNTGIAVSPDGSIMALSLAIAAQQKILVYSLPDGVQVREFGSRGKGPLQFDRIGKLCFSPLNPNNLLIADGFNKRVQVL